MKNLREKCQEMIERTEAKPEFERAFWSVVDFLEEKGADVDADYVWSKYLTLTSRETEDITIQEYMSKNQ